MRSAVLPGRTVIEIRHESPGNGQYLFEKVIGSSNQVPDLVFQISWIASRDSAVSAHETERGFAAMGLSEADQATPQSHDQSNGTEKQQNEEVSNKRRIESAASGG